MEILTHIILYFWKFDCIILVKEIRTDISHSGFRKDALAEVNYKKIVFAFESVQLVGAWE